MGPFYFLALLLALTPANAQTPLLVLPQPTLLTSTPGCLLLSPALALQPAGAGGASPLLAAALARSSALLASLGRRGESVLGAAAAAACAGAAPLSAVTVAVAALPPSPHPALGDDESYSLTLSGDAAGGGLLSSATVWGALRGLETLAQLVSAGAAPDAPGPWRLLIPAGTVLVQDAPRFSHRGLMIDTGRAFLPLSALLATLDAMAYVKLNVLHWHASDDQSFPLRSSAWPNLTAGAFQAPSLSHTYSKVDVAAVVDAASARGIRVLLELDVPGHTASWFEGYPALATRCADPGVFGVPMDVTLNATYDFLGALLQEMALAFPEALLHLGGDEVEGQCWLNSSSIAAFMRAHGIASAAQLQLYFETRAVALLRATGKRAVLWEENFGASNSYPAGAVVEVWKEVAGDWSVLEALARAGYDLIYTTPSWYLDWSATGVAPGGGSSTFDSHVNGPGEWQFYHSVDFLPANTTLTPAQQARVLGGEVCMWSVYEDSTNFFPTVFPRAAAVAERLWSARGEALDEPSALAARMQAMRCRLLARGIAAAPVGLGLSCPSAWAAPYTPPWGENW